MTAAQFGSVNDMGDPPTVSTIITSYNNGPYIAEAIESALCQDYRPHEILVIDDGSTDDTKRVAESFGDRVRYYYKSNGGASSARNRGILLAKGQCIAFLDGDDRWRPGKLRHQMNLLETELGVGVVYSRNATISPATAWQPVLDSVGAKLHRGHILDKLLVRNFIPFSSAIARRECLTAVGLFNERLKVAEDYDLWLRMAHRYTFDYVDEVLLDYRIGVTTTRMSIGIVQYQKDVMAIRRRFVVRCCGKSHPSVAVLKRAAAAAYAELGDHFLDQGRHLRALAAHGSAACLSPLSPSRYAAVLRDLIPNWLVATSRFLWRRVTSSGQETRP